MSHGGGFEILAYFRCRYHLDDCLIFSRVREAVSGKERFGDRHLHVAHMDRQFVEVDALRRVVWRFGAHSGELRHHSLSDRSLRVGKRVLQSATTQSHCPHDRIVRNRRRRELQTSFPGLWRKLAKKGDSTRATDSRIPPNVVRTFSSFLFFGGGRCIVPCGAGLCARCSRSSPELRN